MKVSIHVLGQNLPAQHFDDLNVGFSLCGIFNLCPIRPYEVHGAASSFFKKFIIFDTLILNFTLKKRTCVFNRFFIKSNRIFVIFLV